MSLEFTPSTATHVAAMPSPFAEELEANYVKEPVWTFMDKQGHSITLEWSDASALEAVRSVYLEAYIHDNLYQALFSQLLNKEEAAKTLNVGWDYRSAVYRDKLNKEPPEAYLVVAKRDAKIIGFALFDAEKLGSTSFSSEEVSVSPIMVLPEAQGSGLGKELLFSILKKFPHIKKISLVTTKMWPSADFYRHVGFQEVDNSEYLKSIEDPEFKKNVICFEWINPTGYTPSH